MNRSWIAAAVVTVAFSSVSCLSVRDRVAKRLGLPTKFEKQGALLARHQVTPKAGRPVPVSTPAPVLVAQAPAEFRKHEEPKNHDSHESKHEDHGDAKSEHKEEHKDEHKDGHAKEEKHAPAVEHHETHEAEHAEPAHEEEHAHELVQEVAHEEPAHEEHSALPVQEPAPALTLSPTYPELQSAPKSGEAGLERWRQDVTRYALEKEASRLRWEAAVMRLEAEELRIEVTRLDQHWQDLSSKVASIQSDRHRVRDLVAKLESEIEKTRHEVDSIEAQWSKLALAPSKQIH